MADPAIDQALHQLISLGIEVDVGSRLRDTFGELSVAEIVIGSDSDLPSRADGGLAGVNPVDVEFVEVEAVVGKLIVELCASAASMMLGAPGGGRACPSISALLRKLTPSRKTHCSVAGSPCSILLRSATQACF